MPNPLSRACTFWQKMLLEMHPDAFSGQEFSELQAHLTSCQDCRQVSQKMVVIDSMLTHLIDAALDADLLDLLTPEARIALRNSIQAPTELPQALLNLWQEEDRLATPQDDAQPEPPVSVSPLSNLGEIDAVMVTPSQRICSLLIGVNKYTDQTFADLPFALHDANLLQQELAQYNGSDNDVELLTAKQATKANIVHALSQLAQLASPDTLIFIYFAGHAGRVDQERPNTMYLCLEDTRFDDLEATALHESVLTGFISQIIAQKVILLLDTCDFVKPNGSQRAEGWSFEDCRRLRLSLPNKQMVVASSCANQDGWRDQTGSASVFVDIVARTMREHFSRRNETALRRDLFDEFEEIFQSKEETRDFMLSSAGMSVQPSSLFPNQTQRTKTDAAQPKIFISYSHYDSQFTQRFATDIRSKLGEDSVWFDMDGVRGGEDWWRTITHQLTTRDIFIIVLSPSALASHWVRAEMDIALKLHLKRGLSIFPVIYQACTPLEQWQRFHAFDFTHEQLYEAILEMLLKEVGELLGKRSSIPQDRFPPRLQRLGYQGHIIHGLEVITAPMINIEDSQDEGEENCESHLPQMSIYRYAISKYPVTIAEYACAVRAGAVDVPGRGKQQEKEWADHLERLDHPVINITWQQAADYASWLAELTGESWRLPTETEWKKAAQWDGRASHQGQSFSWSNWIQSGLSDNSLELPHVMGTHLDDVSRYGVCDMHSNLWEWTSSITQPPILRDSSDGSTFRLALTADHT